MSVNDVEKYLPPAGAMEWRRPNKKRRQQRTIALRLLFSVIGLWVLYTLFFAGGPGYTEQQELLAAAENVQDVVNPQPVEPLPPRNATSIKDETAKDQEEKSVKPANTKEVSWPHTDLEAALRNTFTLHPDELQAGSLLKPIEVTGEARLREFGLRTRYYKKLFAAWETVHLVASGDDTGLYIRDDIIQAVQRHPYIAKRLQMTETEIIQSYESYRSIITRLSTLLFPWTAPYFPDHMHLHAQFYRAGKGIVFTAGDKQAPFLLTSIPTLRELGCHLPIEVMYLGDHDLSQSVREQLEALPGVTTRDLAQMVNDQGWKLAGWAGKPFAILFSSFREVIFIDADSLFFQNPELLFVDEDYLETGALFFKDRIILPESKRKFLQEVLPRPLSRQVLESRFWTGDSGHMQESGVVVVDKWRHFIPLLLVTRMNGPDRDGNKAEKIVGVYELVYGDKETFWLGWELAGDLDYAFHRGDAGTMGVLEVNKAKKDEPVEEELEDEDEDEEPEEGALKTTTTPESYTICSPQLLHLDRSGRPLWFNGWVLSNKYQGKNREPTDFQAFVREPREKREPAAWQLHEHNECCLTSEYMSEFRADERAVLDMILASGRRVGALSPTQT
ncbi:mannosyltransferase putative-domain-containing protein [Aspergillus pseudoustus]|uniref:Mannosyltransferase putative-domain-containing protein n=1 Tax=Aspergillus pseudoustus TaxID=1810923 RepID=A0ABR4K694_9EURO